MSRFLAICFLCCAAASFADSPSNGDAVKTFQEGDYKTAIPLLRAAIEKAPEDSALHAALLSSLVYQGQIDDAAELSSLDAEKFPSSAKVIAARGEFAYYQGDMPQAVTLFKAALKLDDSTARGYDGLSRIMHAASMYHSARLFSMKAHDLDSSDAFITEHWLPYAPLEKRKELAAAFVAAHPWFYPDRDKNMFTAGQVNEQLKGRKLYELEGDRKETTLHLEPVMYDATHFRGVGLDFKIQNGRPLRLLLDTGASGILIAQRSADKAGLGHLGSMQISGIGDDGKKAVFASIADSCEVGGLKYKACLITVTEGRRNLVGEVDGLIGADFFSAYLIHLDFQKRQMRLVPQPSREPNPLGYDRSVPADEKEFTPVFRYGHHLYVTTQLNGKINGLFLLDTGASLSNIDSTFARLSTKIHGNSYLHIKGVSGEVKEVFEADKAVLQFSHFRQQNLGLVAFNLNNQPGHEETRMSGILGFPVLEMFRLTLDYRNGLVDFDYTLAAKKRPR